MYANKATKRDKKFSTAQGNRTLYTPFKYSIYCPLMQDEKKKQKTKPDKFNSEESWTNKFPLH